MRRCPLPTLNASSAAALALMLAASGCGKSGPKPKDAEIAGYLAQSQPPYVRVTGVTPEFQSATSNGSGTLPEGSWRIRVTFTLRAMEDLFAPTAAGRAQRAAFDRVVAQTEEFRVARIAAVEQLGRQAGLVAQGASSPEPAMPVAVVTHKDQDRMDEVTLLAQPDGKSWKFFQLDAQALDDSAVGAPLEVLRRNNSGTVFVTDGSDEARQYLMREQRFMQILAKAPKL